MTVRRPNFPPNRLPDLMRRIDRKLDIQRGMALTYDDLALLVASGAYAKLQDANRQYLERQCQEHVARSHFTSEEHSHHALQSAAINGQNPSWEGRAPHFGLDAAHKATVNMTADIVNEILLVNTSGRGVS